MEHAIIDAAPAQRHDTEEKNEPVRRDVHDEDKCIEQKKERRDREMRKVDGSAPIPPVEVTGGFALTENRDGKTA